MSLWGYTVRKIASKHPKFRVVAKESAWIMRLIGWLLTPINREFMENYVTTLGHTIYMPKRLIGTDSGAEILEHEAVHIAQWRRWSLLFSLSYLLLPPIGPGFRAYWEWQAYKQDILLEMKARRGFLPGWYVEHIEEQFTTSAYGWMLPFPRLVRGMIGRFVTRNGGVIDGGSG